MQVAHYKYFAFLDRFQNHVHTIADMCNGCLILFVSHLRNTQGICCGICQISTACAVCGVGSECISGLPCFAWTYLYLCGDGNAALGIGYAHSEKRHSAQTYLHSGGSTRFDNAICHILRIIVFCLGDGHIVAYVGALARCPLCQNLLFHGRTVVLGVDNLYCNPIECFAGSSVHYANGGIGSRRWYRTGSLTGHFELYRKLQTDKQIIKFGIGECQHCIRGLRTIIILVENQRHCPCRVIGIQYTVFGKCAYFVMNMFASERQSLARFDTFLVFLVRLCLHPLIKVNAKLGTDTYRRLAHIEFAVVGSGLRYIHNTHSVWFQYLLILHRDVILPAL